MRLIRFCSSASEDQEKRTRHYLSLEGLTYARAHPEDFGFDPDENLFPIVQQGVAWLNEG